MSKVVTVLSNESMKLFPNNTIARFRNALDLQLDFSKNYQVCLHDISFTKSWFNFTRDETYTVTYSLGGANPNERIIAPGYYEKKVFQDSAKNRTFQNGTFHSNQECSIGFDEPSHKFVILFIRNQGKKKKGRPIEHDRVTLSADLSRKLGFGDKERTFDWDNGLDMQTYYSDHTIYFDPIDFFSVSTSLIKPTHNIGDQLYPCIAFVPSTSGKHGARESYSPRDPIWFELSREEIHQPEFILTTINGDLMPFEFGPCSITLLIREDA